MHISRASLENLNDAFEVEPGRGGERDQGCNSIDIWNLRLELGRKLGKGLRTRLGTRLLVVS